MSWIYKERNEDFPFSTELFFKVLPKSGFTPEGLLIREALQNCKDARSRESKERRIPVNVTVEQVEFNGSKKRQLVSTLGLDKIGEEKISLINNNDRIESFSELISGNTPISSAIISDYNTVGLGGKWNGWGKDDHFRKLVMGLGDSDKEDEPGRGGSFGFGKTVYFKPSRIHLVLYYSHFEENDQTEGHSARFMGVWLLKAKDNFSGFSYFAKTDSQTKKYTPFINEEAHKLAEACGIKRRGNSDYGTSVMIIDCELNPEKIKDSTEKFWWPSIPEKLSVKISANDKDYNVSPSDNPHCTPYIHLFNELKDVKPGVRSTLDLPCGGKAEKFRNWTGTNTELGVIAWKILDDAEKAAIEKHERAIYPISDEEKVKIGGAAKIRESGMVIKYDHESINHEQPVAVLFVAHEEVDAILRASEPQTHDFWDDEEEDRIIEAAEKSGIVPSTEGPKIVKSINTRISSKTADVLRSQPAPPPPDSFRLKELEKLLSQVLRIGDGRPIIPKGPARPFSIQLQEKRIPEAENPTLADDTASIILTLNDDYDNNELEVLVEVECQVLGDTRGSSVEKLKVDLFDQNKNLHSGTSNKPSTKVVLKKGEAYQLIAQAKCDINNLTRFKASVSNPNK